MKQILVINPGSTSTKVAIFHDYEEKFKQTIDHSRVEIAQYETIAAQLPMRKECVLEFLAKHNIAVSDLDAIVARGGMLPPVQHGAYVVDEHMVDVLLHHPAENHASNLGAPIAHALAAPMGIPAYIYDSVSVDELLPEARLSGLKGYDRQSFSHALNMRAAARKVAEDLYLDYNKSRMIVAHLGGGISLSLQSKGKLIDIVAGDEAPFSSERAGSMPMYQVISLVRNQGIEGLVKSQAGQGGLVSYIGSNDLRDLIKLRKDGNQAAILIYDALVLQISKAIWQLAALVNGDVDAIVLTGGMAHSEELCDLIGFRCAKLAIVASMPGEFEMEALAHGAMRVLEGEEVAAVLPTA